MTVLKTKLLDDKPENRPTIEETLNIIRKFKSVGNDVVDFKPLMNELKSKIISDPSSLGLPDNIEEIKKLYI